ncbi:unnamed protein product [Protopolystoma xenopodis]|uniref:Uncharacterized protein n=1 Tax=Protopolystoma xenopodis TaxID=117903 RepID=A0A448X1D1_9PLAT|nr:unnamed protein product [Protopolystoma xenopodis]
MVDESSSSASGIIRVESPCHSVGKYMCRDGTCRDRILFCNGIADCADSSDEEPPHCCKSAQLFYPLIPAVCLRQSLPNQSASGDLSTHGP